MFGTTTIDDVGSWERVVHKDGAPGTIEFFLHLKYNNGFACLHGHCLTSEVMFCIKTL